MPFHHNQEVIVAYTIDYSANQNTLTIYEVQQFGSNHFYTKNRELLQRVSEQQALWFEHFRESYANHFLVDLPSVLNGSKYEQRKLFISNPNTVSLCPNLLLCNKQMSIADILHFIHRYNNKVVLKATGSCGKRNVFLRDIASEEETQALLEDFMRKNADFVVEQEVMHAPDAAVSQVGVYYRSIVFYNTVRKTVQFFDVYKMLLNTDLSTNSHFDLAFSGKELYFLTHNVASLRCKMNLDRRDNPALHAIKISAFQNVGELLTDYIFRDSNNVLSTMRDRSVAWFVNTFHDNNMDAYKDFFRRVPEVVATPARNQNHLFFSNVVTSRQNNFCGFNSGFLVGKRF